MCDNPKVALMLKSEYDIQFQLLGVRTKPKFVGRLSDYAKEVVNSGFNYSLYHIESHFPPEYNVIFIPCRKCFSCRLDHSRRRAAQAYCEYKTSEKACFLTLTFGDISTYDYFRKDKNMSCYLARRHTDFLSWSLDSECFKNFMKRLRDHIRQVDMRRFCLQHQDLHKCIFKCDKYGHIDYDVPRHRVKFFEFKDFILQNCQFRKIRFLHSAEYGSRRGRPHHHCILYGVDFNEYSDFYTKTVYHSGQKQVNGYSRTLDKLWKFGEVTVGKCNYNTIHYVSRYCLKKVLGENSSQYYSGRCPEYNTCSTRPALGHQYLIENFNDIVRNRNILIQNNKGELYNAHLPRYFSDFIKKQSTIQNDGLAYTSYSDIMFQRDCDKSVERYNQILNDDFYNWSKRKQCDADKIVKSLKRSYDDSNVVDLSLIRKLKAFGISYEYYSDNKKACDYLFDYLSLSYKGFEPYFQNSNKKSYYDFERMREHMLSDLRKKYISSLYRYEELLPVINNLRIRNLSSKNIKLSLIVNYGFNISDCESYFSKVHKIKSLVNPFKNSVRSKKVLGNNFTKNFIGNLVKCLN